MSDKSKPRVIINDVEDPQRVKEIAEAAAQVPTIAVAVEDPEELLTKIEKEKTSSIQKEDAPQKEIKLSLPIEVDGKQVETLKPDVDKLTAAAATKAERIFALKCPDFAGVMLDSLTFWMILSSITVGISYEVVEKMPMMDALNLVGMVKLLFFKR